MNRIVSPADISIPAVLVAGGNSAAAVPFPDVVRIPVRIVSRTPFASSAAQTEENR